MLRFNVDRNDNTVAGWAFNDENLDEVVEIFVECDGVIIDFFFSKFI